MRIHSIAVGLALASTFIGSARATEVLFTITGDHPTSTFELPLSPTPDGVVALGVGFEILSVPAIVGGVPTALTDLTFFSYGEPGGGGFNDDVYFRFYGPQFYTGPESSPTFVPGVYAGLSDPLNGDVDTVTVTELPVPEIPTCMLMLLGFAGIGFGVTRGAKSRAALGAQQA